MNRYFEFAATATADDLKRAEAKAEARVSREAPQATADEIEAIRQNAQPARFVFVEGLKNVDASELS